MLILPQSHMNISKVLFAKTGKRLNKLPIYRENTGIEKLESIASAASSMKVAVSVGTAIIFLVIVDLLVTWLAT
jgi:hypothetical protein